LWLKRYEIFCFNNWTQILRWINTIWNWKIMFCTVHLRVPKTIWKKKKPATDWRHSNRHTSSPYFCYDFFHCFQLGICLVRDINDGVVKAYWINFVKNNGLCMYSFLKSHWNTQFGFLASLFHFQCAGIYRFREKCKKFNGGETSWQWT